MVELANCSDLGGGGKGCDDGKGPEVDEVGEAEEEGSRGLVGVTCALEEVVNARVGFRCN